MTKVLRTPRQLLHRKRRLLRVWVGKMLPMRQDPARVAWSLALGIFIAILPTQGISLPLTLLVLGLLKLPKVPGLTSSWIGSPVTLFGFFYPVSYALGCWLWPPHLGGVAFLKKRELTRWANLGTQLHWLVFDAWDHLLAFFIGSTLMATGFAMGAWFLSFELLKYRRRLRVARRLLSVSV